MRPAESIEVTFGCSFELRQGVLRMIPNSPSTLVGVPYDRPVVGYGGNTVNTLRLWSATASEGFDFQRFSGGDFVASIAEALNAELLTRVLYPDDHTVQGRELRLMQEYFLVACSLGDIVRRFRQSNSDWRTLPEKAAIQMNDTHPTLAAPELMRILLDEAHLGWDEAFDLTKRTLAYTNHTLLPEALERWPAEWMQFLIPRHLEIIYEINRRLMDDIRARFPGDDGRAGPDQPGRGGAGRSTSGWRIWRLSPRTAPTAWRRSIPSFCARRRSATSLRPFPSGSATRRTG